MHWHKHLLLVLILTIAVARGAAIEPRFWGGLVAGEYAVGFKTFEVPAEGDKPPLQVVVWYPAANTDTPKLNFGAYLRLSTDLLGAEPEFVNSYAATRRALSTAITGTPDTLSAAVADEILANPMAASKDVAAAPGRFPLVLWTPRYATTVSQSVVSEFLASRGYIVAFGRRTANPEPLPFQAKSSREKQVALLDMVNDMSRTFTYLRSNVNVDAERVATIAWSYTGEAATAFQLAEPAVKLVIGFSTPLLSDWVYGTPESAGEVARKITVPYALLSEATRRDGTETHSPELMKALRTDAFFIRIPGAAHGTFNGLEGLIPAVMGIQRIQPWSAAGEPAIKAHQVTSVLTLRLLDHYLVEQRTQATPFQGALPGADVESTDFELEEHVNRPPMRQPEFTTVKFRTSDDVEVSADLYGKDKKSPVIVLLHQSGNSRGEYRQIAPRLIKLGFTALAVDARWGGKSDRWNNVPNETAAGYGTLEVVAKMNREQFPKIRAGIPLDIMAAFDWLDHNGYRGQKILWGSSITANAVLEFASKNQPRLAAVMPFSPGEYDPKAPHAMQDTVKELKLPTFVACGYDELDLAKPIFDAIPGRKKTLYRATRGRHGSSILLDDVSNWKAVEDFLKAFQPVADTAQR